MEIFLMVKNSQLYQYDSSEMKFFENKEEVAIEQFLKLLNSEKYYWLNFQSIDNKKLIASLIERLGIDKLVNDEIYSNFRRSKFMDFENTLYFKMKSVLPNNKEGMMEEDKLSFVMGKNYILTFQEKNSDHFVDAIELMNIETSRLRAKGTDFLLYKLLDAIMDNYSETLDNLSDGIESLRDRIHSSKGISNGYQGYLKEIEKFKRNLMSLRRIVFPIKDISTEIQHLDTSLIQKENKLFYKKLNNSCSWLVEEIDANRQVLEGLTNICFAMSSQRLNEVIKLLTLVSTIFIPLTFIVGVYGMNFKFMPELEFRNGYFLVWGAMAVIAILMMLYFWKKGWFNKMD